MVFPIVGGDGKPTGYEISNSLRFEGSGAIGLARFGNNSRNGNTFTISAWIKRAKLGANTVLFNSKVEDSGVNAFIIMFESDDKISIGGQPASGSGAGGHRTVIKTNAVFRDPSAWYHMVYRQDTTQGTASNRHILYINGEATDNGTYAALDQNVAFNYFYNASSYPFAIANDERDNSYGSFYIAEHHYTDGVSNGPDAFGETNDNGVWIPKEYTGSHGSYGHYLKFEQSGGGSGTTAIGGHDYTTGSSSTIGADSSGNDNHFHVQGYGTEDNTTDTPTNNFATANPLGSNASAFAEGNTKTTGDTGTSYSLGASSSIGFKSGKWYMEFKVSDVGNNTYIGLMKDGNHLSVNGDYQYPLGNLFYRHDGDKLTGSGSGFGVDTTYGDTFTDNDIIGVAADMDNRNLYFYKNGTIQNSGTAAFTSSLISSTAGSSIEDDTYYFFFTAGYNDSILFHNYGQPSFSISSGNTDANGYGNFEYAVPSGYYSLCTKNLAEFG